MYLLQKGIEYCAMFIVMMSLSFVPGIIFTLQIFDPRLQWSNVTLVGVIFLLCLGILSVYIEGERR